MAVTVLCPNLLCRKPLQVAETDRGQQVRCPFCRQVLTVPVTRPAPTPRKQPDVSPS